MNNSFRITRKTQRREEVWEVLSFTRIAVVNQAEEERAPFARDADLGYCLGPASAWPYLDLAALERAGRDRRGPGLAGLGVRRRGPGIRRAV